MAERDNDDKQHREQTDESLRIERLKSDAASTDKQHAIEQTADSVVQVARDRADKVVEAAREDADEAAPGVTSAVSERERDLADAVLSRERATADAVLEQERVERRKSFQIFLANEREATDLNLTDERAEADATVAVRDDFLTTVSHDLRSLLGGISLSAQVLIDSAPAGAAGDTARKYAGMSQRLVLRMSRLVNDLLDMASIEAGKVELLIEENEVADLLRETLEAFEPLAAAKGVVLRVITEPPYAGRFDTGRILQVLANLVSNAIKFTPPGGQVSIGVVSESDHLSFTVRDTGIGIPQDALHDVFEKFKQVAADRRGVGMGLYISKGLVEAHGGYIWAESEPGAGSIFHFTIPTSIVRR